MSGTGRVRRGGRGTVIGVVPSLLVVVGAFVLGQLPLLAASWTADAPDPAVIHEPVRFFEATTWGRFDTWLYLDVARSGPSLERCQEGPWGPDDWCGTSGWLPLFPGVVRAATELTGWDDVVVGALVARLSHLALLGVVWFAVLRRRWRTPDVLALGAVSVSAGLVYLVAIFPMSLASLGVVASLALLDRKRWVWAGMAAGLAATAHTMAVAVVGAGILGIVVVDGRSGEGARFALRPTLGRVARFVAPAAGCYVAMLAWYQWQVGRWDAPFLTQRKYGHHVTLPPQVVIERVTDLVAAPAGTPRWPLVQTALVAALVVAVVAVALPQWGRLERIDRYLVLATVALWSAPLAYGGVEASYHRLEALVVPLGVLTRILPRWAQVTAVAALAVTAYGVARPFFSGAIV